MYAPKIGGPPVRWAGLSRGATAGARYASKLETTGHPSPAYRPVLSSRGAGATTVNRGRAREASKYRPETRDAALPGALNAASAFQVEARMRYWCPLGLRTIASATWTISMTPRNTLFHSGSL